MPLHSSRREANSHSPLQIYLHDINDTALLTAQEERELAARVAQGDPYAREHMVKANLRLVVNIARGYLNKGLCLEDLIEEGNLGLMRAVEGYDGTMETRFSTYASYWIKQSIRRAVMNNGKPIRLPAYMVSLLAKWKRVTIGLTDRLGRAPTPEEVGRALRLSQKKVDIVEQAIQVNNLTPHSENSEEDGFALNEVLTDDRIKAPDDLKGRTLGVVGESGSGKTTVGMLLTRLTEASAGSVRFDGRDLMELNASQMRAYRSRIQIIFQNPYASLNPRFTVGQILIEPMGIHAIGKDERERVAMAMALLDKVGLPAGAFGKYPHEFSGGQRQRIAIARCLSMKPQIIVCDESVSALDVSVQATVLNLLLDLQEEFGLSYLFISHDLAVVRYMADEVLVMSQGEIVERGSAEQIYAAPQHPYTQQLLSAIPRGFQGPTVSP